MKKPFFKALYLLLAIPAIWFSVHLYNRHELTNYYRKELESMYYFIYGIDLTITKEYRLKAMEEDREKVEKIKEQMYQDGYNRAEIEKIDLKAFDKGIERGHKAIEDIEKIRAKKEAKIPE